MTPMAESEAQALFHQRLFASLFQWDEVWKAALELAGEHDAALELGLDQLGHFGPPGVKLVADRLVASAHGPLARVLELGSGFGGALRHLGRRLRSHGFRSRLVGVELVREHCVLACAIGRATGDGDALIVNADVARLPFRPASLDAVFAVGSTSHFLSVGDALAECGRVLRADGVLVMAEEVSLRPPGGPEPGDVFTSHHPPHVFRMASPGQRRAELDDAGLAIEAFESLRSWALPLLRQRVHALVLLGGCANRIFGAESAQRVIETLRSAADEYERGSIDPVLVVARRTGI
jgi:SAM-dependent methyltransferase